MASESISNVTLANHSDVFFKNIDLLQQQNIMCDLKICLDDGSFLCHSIVLAANSPKVTQELSSLKALSPEESSIDVIAAMVADTFKHVKYDTAFQLMTFLYTGNITFEKCDVEPLYLCSKELGIIALIGLIEQYKNAQSKDEANTDNFEIVETKSNDPAIAKLENVDLKKWIVSVFEEKSPAGDNVSIKNEHALSNDGEGNTMYLGNNRLGDNSPAEYDKQKSDVSSVSSYDVKDHDYMSQISLEHDASSMSYAEGREYMNQIPLEHFFGKEPALGLQCDSCGKLFSCKSRCERHKATCQKSGPNMCENCGKSFVYKRSFNRHVEECKSVTPHKNKAKTKADEDCEMQDSELVKMQQDEEISIRSGHSEKTVGLLKCNKCNKQYRYATSLKKHCQRMCIHELRGNVEDKVTEEPKFEIKHTKIHLISQKRLKWQKKQKQMGTLKMKQNYKAFKCLKCYKKFKFYAKLKIHEAKRICLRRKTSLLPRMKQHSCDVCHKRFSTVAYVRVSLTIIELLVVAEKQF